MRTTGSEPKTFCEMDRLFLRRETLDALLEKHGTPLCIYDEKGLRLGARSLLSKFAGGDPSVISMPVFACPRREVLSVLAQEGISAHCRTKQELQLALDCGFAGKNIVYTMLIPDEKLASQLKELDARLIIPNPNVLNGPLPRRVDLVCARQQSKITMLMPSKALRAHMGFHRPEVWDLAPKLADRGIELGLARLDGMNAIEMTTHEMKIKQLQRYADALAEDTGVRVARLCPGAGLGVNYHRNGPGVDEDMFADAFRQMMSGRSEQLCVDMDTRLVEPHAILVTTLLEIIYRDRPSLYVDTPSSVLLQPRMERFHHSSILGKEWLEGRKVCDVSGPLPIRLDHYADRCILPEAEIGDKVIFHDVGTSLLPEAPVPTFFHQEDGTVVPLKAW